MSNEVKLGNDEHVIKFWEYGKQKRFFRTYATSSLTVTNKRVVAITDSKRGIMRDDMPVSAVNGISASCLSYCTLFFKILFVLFGIIFCATLIFIPLGINLFDKAFGNSLTVTLEGAPSHDPVISTSSSIRWFGKKWKKRVVVKVNKSCAKEIVEQLATIIFVDLKK